MPTQAQTNREKEYPAIGYVCSIVSKVMLDRLLQSGRATPTIAPQKFHRLILEGFLHNNCDDVTVFSAPPISRRISTDWISLSSREEIEGIKYQYAGFINIPIFRQICLLLGTIVSVLRWKSKRPSSALIVDSLNMAISIGALLSARIAKIPAIAIVTDIPEIRAAVRRPRSTDIARRIAAKLTTLCFPFYDGYIVLTNAMLSVVNPHDKPAVVMEGLVDVNAPPMASGTASQNARICLYTGSTHACYGLPTLVQAFIDAEVPNCELHIFGSGDFDSELKNIVQNNGSIRYHGIAPNDYVVKEQRSATLLINPRPSAPTYTRYSFPSKNMEYMVSGTPTLTTRLPGMPSEYDDYVFSITDESVSGICHALQEILALPSEELEMVGRRAQDFVLREKNNQILVKIRVLDLIRQVRDGFPNTRHSTGAIHSSTGAGMRSNGGSNASA